jgi:hypothetical protein
MPIPIFALYGRVTNMQTRRHSGGAQRRKTRISKKAQCLRRAAATARIKSTGMFDNAKFDLALLTNILSGKFNGLITKIRELDTNDLHTHGVKFKHFIFTDLREAAYGVKALAGFMIAAGFDLRMANAPKQIRRGGRLVPTQHGETQLVVKEPVVGGCNGFAVLQSLPMWKNPLSVAVKKEILRVYNARPENINGELLRIIILDSKYKEGIDLFDVRYVHLLEPQIATSDLKQAVGRATRYCGQRGLRFIPRRGWKLDVFTYRTELPGRAPFGDTSTQKVDAHELMLSHSGLDLALLRSTEEISQLAIRTAVDYDLNANINKFALTPQVGGAVALTPRTLERCKTRKNELFPYTRKTMESLARRMHLRVPAGSKRAYFCELLRKYPEYMAALNSAGSYETPRKAPRAPPPTPTSRDDIDLEAAARRSFPAFQTAIRRMYGAFAWDAPVVASGCDAVAAARHGAPVTFTRTQDFVRHYLTPASPFKGLLAWHSVGTGKTCMAVAATGAFEAAGYKILWVTRNALMSDVYKNIFGAVCSLPIAAAIADGAVVPEDLKAAKKMLSRAWFPPISYRMFQNALERKNELGRALWGAQPRDPLRRVFLVMDEIHKLRDGDLSPAEAADFATIQRFIHDSYSASGEDSVRVLLMTATPITDSPDELFDILNTLIPTARNRLVSFDAFRERFTSSDGAITEAGATYFQERAKGLISYLNREQDPTTFAQPTFHTVSVAAGAAPVPDIDDLVARCLAGAPPLTVADESACDEVTALSAIKRRTEAQTRRLKTARKECRAARAATKKAARARRAAASKCYTAEKKKFRSAGNSQIAEIAKCLGERDAAGEFPERAAFLEALATAPRTPESISTTDAVYRLV